MNIGTFSHHNVDNDTWVIREQIDVQERVWIVIDVQHEMREVVGVDVTVQLGHSRQTRKYRRPTRHRFQTVVGLTYLHGVHAFYFELFVFDFQKEAWASDLCDKGRHRQG